MAHELTCPQAPLKTLTGVVPAKFLEAVEHNQLTNHCCRNLVEHGATIEAWKSKPDEPAPDIYVIQCGGCGRKHRRFMMGEGPRPVWEIR